MKRNKFTARDSKLALEKQQAEGDKPFKCDFQDCGKAYVAEHSLTKHINDKHANK